MTVLPTVSRRGLCQFVAIVGLLLVVTSGVAAAQQGPLDVTVRSAEVDEDGTTTVLVDVKGAGAAALGGDAFILTEAGEPIEGFTASLSNEAVDPEARAVVIALDTSGSTAGEPIELAKAAVQEFVTTVTQRDVAVGLVTFADTAQVAVAPTTDAAPVLTAVDAVVADGGTALYDAVILAAREVQELRGQRSIVVFSDGTDSNSEANLATTLRATTAVGARVSSVVLQTEAFDLQSLQAMADVTHGSLLEVTTADELQAAFASVAQTFTNQYVLTYPNTGLTGQFDVQVTVAVDGATSADTIAVLSTVSKTATVGSADSVSIDAPGPLQQPVVGWLAVAATALGVLLLLVMLLVPSGDRAVLANMRASLGTRDDQTRIKTDLNPTTAALSRRAIQLVERVPKPEGYDNAIQQRLDRASWPVRSAEFTTSRSIAGLVGLGLVWAFSGSFLFGVLGAAAGWGIPGLMLTNRVHTRQQQFMGQLPDTLQLLAGSMKAGYGVLQAIDTVVKEAQEPTRSEFQRVITESRLGMPLEDSLSAMADRIGSEDFRWVAVAINIQRRVGGNLASLLETVSATLRERAATRGQIQSLSAEGRISGVILTALPIVLGLYMFVANRDYVSVLFTDPRGNLMLFGGIMSMIIGVIWMKSLIEIDV